MLQIRKPARADPEFKWHLQVSTSKIFTLSDNFQVGLETSMRRIQQHGAS